MLLMGLWMIVDHLWVVKNMIAGTIKMGMLIVVGTHIFTSWELSAYYWRHGKIQNDEWIFNTIENEWKWLECSGCVLFLKATLNRS